MSMYKSMKNYIRSAAQHSYHLKSILPITIGTGYYLSQIKRTIVSSCQADKPKLYQYKICPFCNRVKAYLDFLKIEYVTIEVDPISKSEIKFSTNHKKVPIAIINDVTVVDSGNIINSITDSLLKDSSLKVNKDLFLPKDTDYWSEWSEKKLAVMLYPNITRSFDESWECFGYSSEVKTWSYPTRMMVRVIGPIGMLFANGKIKKKYGIVDERNELFAVINEWSTALNNQKFLHGDEISLPDLLVFGVVRSIEGLQTFKEIMKQDEVFETWYKNVESVTKSHEVIA